MITLQTPPLVAPAAPSLVHALWAAAFFLPILGPTLRCFHRLVAVAFDAILHGFCAVLAVLLARHPCPAPAKHLAQHDLSTHVAAWLSVHPTRSRILVSAPYGHHDTPGDFSVRLPPADTS